MCGSTVSARPSGIHHHDIRAGIHDYDGCAADHDRGSFALDHDGTAAVHDHHIDDRPGRARRNDRAGL